MSHMPNNVRKRIVDCCARNETVVVVPREGKPSRVFNLEKFLKMKEVPIRHKPWNHRRAAKEQPDPLGAVDGEVLGPLRRENIYEATRDVKMREVDAYDI